MQTQTDTHQDTHTTMMKSFAVLATLLAGASAFAPAAPTVSKTTALNSVFDDYVGAVDFRGNKFEFDPVSP